MTNPTPEGDRPMRNQSDVLIDDKATGTYLAAGVDRSEQGLARFVRLDLNGSTLLLGPNRARQLADLLRQHAEAASR